MEVTPRDYDLARLTTDAFSRLVDGDRPVVVLLPVGSLEPHGPHMAMAADSVISHSAAIRAARTLAEENVKPLIAPLLPYGVTRCAAAFKGAITVPPDALTSYLQSVVQSFLEDGVAHVCVINNHLEPEHVEAVRAALRDVGNASIACPLDKRWARTLSDEFKSGACHAGKYETSIVLAASPELVDDDARAELPEVPISLSRQLQAGVTDFIEMGLTRAYSGAPAAANAEHGDDMLGRLATMIVTEVHESLARD